VSFITNNYPSFFISAILKRKEQTMIYYEYDDVFIRPSFSNIISRAEVDTSALLASSSSNLAMKLRVPVIAANMDTITEGEMAKALAEVGACGAIHRFLPIADNVLSYLQVASNEGLDCFVSIGTSRDWQERAEALYSAGARFFVVDIAHGHSQMMKNTVSWLRERFGRDVFIMAGNVGTPQGAADLDRWGVDAIKVGIGGGFVCETKNVTGVNTPMFTTVRECAAVTDKPIIADGGARAYGDVAKAIGAGATAVMSGYFFAGCPENPERSKIYDPVNHTYKPIYRGMASRDAMAVIREAEKGLPTPEGRSTTTNLKPSAKVVVEEIAGGLRSAFSYIGARTTHEFSSKVSFGYRR
jgi:IMP dehydrogenase